MTYFLYVLTNVIFPIFFIIGVGFIIQKKFKLNMNTLSKLQFFVFIPALLFVKIVEMTVALSLFWTVLQVLVLTFIAIYIISLFTTKVMKYEKKTSASFINSTILFNSGNFCIPLIELLFKTNPLAHAVQIIILIFQSTMTNTFGVVNANLGNKDLKAAFITILKMPILYTIILAIIFKTGELPVWPPIWDALNMISQGIIPLALITLGAQLSEIKLSFKVPKVYVATIIRLIVSPFIAFIFVKLFGLSGVIAQVIVICYAAPSAVNSLLLAIEYDNDLELPSQTVFLSTLLSAFSVTVVIYLATYFL